MVNPRAFAVTACGVLAAAAAILALPPQARAQAIPEQSYPERTVRIIVPTAAGGSIDTTARVVAAASESEEVPVAGWLLSGAPEEIRTPDPQIRSLVQHWARPRLAIESRRRLAATERNDGA